jgi:hypothetical protein
MSNKCYFTNKTKAFLFLRNINCEIPKNIIANLVYLCKNYIHGDFSLSKMSKYSYYKKRCH